MSTHLLPFCPSEQPAKKLRSCLSPSRFPLRPLSPTEDDMDLPPRSPSACSTVSSVYTEGPDGLWVKRAKSVRWEVEHDGGVVTVSCLPLAPRHPRSHPVLL